MATPINKYLLLGLKYNPFPDTGAEAYVRSLEDLIIAEIPSYKHVYDALKGYAREIDRKIILFMVAGEWGIGKTHTLLSFAKMLKERYEDKAIPVYIGPTPLASETDFYSKISKRLAEELQNARFSVSVLIDNLVNCSNQDCFFESLVNLRQRGYIVYLALDQLEQDIDPLIRSGHTAAVKEISQRLESFARRILQLGSGIALGLGVYSIASISALQDIVAKRIFDYFELGFLGLQDIEVLIKRYLQEACASEEELAKGGLPRNVIESILKLREKYPYYPFDESVMKGLYDLCGEGMTTPRCVIEYARKAIENALSGAAPEEPVVITEHYLYSNALEAAWANALKEWQKHMSWKAFVTSIIRILSKAAQEKMLVVFPSKVVNESDVRRLKIKKPYRLRDNELVIESQGETFVYISRKVTRKIDPKEVKKVLDRALQLREVGFSVIKTILITLTDPDDEARRWISSAQTIHNMIFEVAKVNPGVRTLGRILFTAKHLDDYYELKRLGLNLHEELKAIMSMLKIKIV